MQRPKLSRHVAYWLIADFVVAAIFLEFALHKGVPVLRHDWGLPHNSEGWRAFAKAMTSGWDQNGIGQPRPYPTLYILGPLLAAIGLGFGSYWAIASFLGAIAFFMIAGTRKLANAFDAPHWVGISLAISALFNPWMFEELVAGHLTMMLSLSVCLFFAASLISGRVSPLGLFICGYIAAFQIQYGLLAAFILFLIRPKYAVFFLTLLGSLTSLLPSIIGIALSRSFLSHIPYFLYWQLNNSVPLNKGLFLDGYSPNYAHSPNILFDLASTSLLFSALISFRVCHDSVRRRELVLRLIAAALLLLIFCSGLRGPASQVYIQLLKFRPILVFRELFDLIGIVALVYLILAAIGAGRSPIARAATGIAAVCFLSAWIVFPPFVYWVPADAVPKANIVSKADNLRFVMMPWLQPLRFYKMGSGADPDIYARANNYTPLNQYQYSYPVGEAIASYIRTGNVNALEALSVAQIYTRSYFSSNLTAIVGGNPADESLPMTSAATRLSPRPELELTSIPPSSDRILPYEHPYLLGNGKPFVFLENASPVETSPASSSAVRSWISLDEASPGFPNIGSPFGGAFTLSHLAKLSVPHHQPLAVLARIRGELRGDGHLLSRSTLGWRWVPLENARSLTCDGSCAVTLWQTRPFPAIPQTKRSPISRFAIPFRELLPYVITARIRLASPLAHRSLIVYRSRYDVNWRLFGLSSPEHVDYSMIFNAFELPRGFDGGSFVIIDIAAALQASAMLISGLTFLVVLAISSLNFLRHNT